MDVRNGPSPVFGLLTGIGILCFLRHSEFSARDLKNPPNREMPTISVFFAVSSERETPLGRAALAKPIPRGTDTLFKV
jgi:hypothetical protein